MPWPSACTITTASAADMLHAMRIVVATSLITALVGGCWSPPPVCDRQRPADPAWQALGLPLGDDFAVCERSDARVLAAAESRGPAEVSEAYEAHLVERGWSAIGHDASAGHLQVVVRKGGDVLSLWFVESNGGTNLDVVHVASCTGSLPAAAWTEPLQPLVSSGKAFVCDPTGEAAELTLLIDGADVDAACTTIADHVAAARYLPNRMMGSCGFSNGTERFAVYPGESVTRTPVPVTRVKIRAR